MADTPATMFLKAHNVAHTEHEYEYVERGGTGVSAELLGVPEYDVAKTLMMQDEAAKPLCASGLDGWTNFQYQTVANAKKKGPGRKKALRCSWSGAVKWRSPNSRSPSGKANEAKIR